MSNKRSSYLNNQAASLKIMRESGEEEMGAGGFFKMRRLAKILPLNYYLPFPTLKFRKSAFRNILLR